MESNRVSSRMERGTAERSAAQSTAGGNFPGVEGPTLGQGLSLAAPASARRAAKKAKVPGRQNSNCSWTLWIAPREGTRGTEIREYTGGPQHTGSGMHETWDNRPALHRLCRWREPKGHGTQEKQLRRGTLQRDSHQVPGGA